MLLNLDPDLAYLSLAELAVVSYLEIIKARFCRLYIL
jgi:uncharacterized membrane protein